MNILKVPQAELDLAWPVALPLLRRANVPGEEMDEKEVRQELEQGLMQLWLGEHRAFACLTCLRKGEEKPFAQIYMLGGTKIASWYVDLFFALYAWGRGQHATHLQVDYPRPGWRKFLAHLGFTELDQDTLVKEIAQ